MTRSIISGDADGVQARRRRRHALRVLSAADIDKLRLFYLGLDTEGRRRRFAAAVSDHSIDRYCHGIDWHRSLILGRAGEYFFDAIVELHPMSDGWDTTEITLTCPLSCTTTEILSELVQLAFLLAGQRGCRRFSIARDDCCPNTLTLLEQVGAVERGGGHLTVGLGDYTLVPIRAAATGTARPVANRSPISAGESQHADLYPDPRDRSADPRCAHEISVRSR